MFEVLHGLLVQLRVVGTYQGHDLGLLKENTMISDGECTVSHRRLLQLPQMTTLAVFTNVSADAALRDADVHLAARTRYTVHATR